MTALKTMSPIGVALVIVILFSVLDREKTPAVTTNHVHATVPAASAAKPVMISAEAAQRIGVTFAPVTLGPVMREIRTVAQVTFDETKVKIISPKIDGWVEQLYVNFTGQPVSAGQTLLSVYSPMLVSAVA